MTVVREEVLVSRPSRGRDSGEHAAGHSKQAVTFKQRACCIVDYYVPKLLRAAEGAGVARSPRTEMPKGSFAFEGSLDSGTMACLELLW
jgi:hypothetical protein